MTDDMTNAAGERSEEDFGGFLGRRLRSYQSGILGLGSLNDVPVASASEQGGSVINRSVEFSNSLQSLLSYRGSSPAPQSAPPPAERAVSRLAEEPEPEAPAAPAAAPEALPAPTGPIAFGSEEWFARMNARQRAIESRKAEMPQVASGPSAAAIEAALGINRGAPAPAADGGPVRRRSSVQEMSGGGLEFGPDWSTSSAGAPAGEPAEPAAPAVEATPPAAAAPTPAAVAPPASTTAPVQRAIETEPEPRVAEPILQRRPRRGSTSNSTPPQAAPVAPAATSAVEAAAAVPPPADPGPAPVRRKLEAVAPPRDDPPETGRDGVRRVTPVAPRPAPAATGPAIPAAPSPATEAHDEASAQAIPGSAPVQSAVEAGEAGTALAQDMPLALPQASSETAAAAAPTAQRTTDETSSSETPTDAGVPAVSAETPTSPSAEVQRATAVVEAPPGPERTETLAPAPRIAEPPNDLPTTVAVPPVNESTGATAAAAASASATTASTNIAPTPAPPATETAGEPVVPRSTSSATASAAVPAATSSPASSAQRTTSTEAASSSPPPLAEGAQRPATQPTVPNATEAPIRRRADAQPPETADVPSSEPLLGPETAPISRVEPQTVPAAMPTVDAAPGSEPPSAQAEPSAARPAAPLAAANAPTIPAAAPAGDAAESPRSDTPDGAATAPSASAPARSTPAPIRRRVDPEAPEPAVAQSEELPVAPGALRPASTGVAAETPAASGSAPLARRTADEESAPPAMVAADASPASDAPAFFPPEPTAVTPPPEAKPTASGDIRRSVTATPPAPALESTTADSETVPAPAPSPSTGASAGSTATSRSTATLQSPQTPTASGGGQQTGGGPVSERPSAQSSAGPVERSAPAPERSGPASPLAPSHSTETGTGERPSVQRLLADPVVADTAAEPLPPPAASAVPNAPDASPQPADQSNSVISSPADTPAQATPAAHPAPSEAHGNVFVSPGTVPATSAGPGTSSSPVQRRDEPAAISTVTEAAETPAISRLVVAEPSSLEPAAEQPLEIPASGSPAAVQPAAAVSSPQPTGSATEAPTAPEKSPSQPERGPAAAADAPNSPTISRVVADQPAPAAASPLEPAPQAPGPAAVSPGALPASAATVATPAAQPGAPIQRSAEPQGVIEAVGTALDSSPGPIAMPLAASAPHPGSSRLAELEETGPTLPRARATVEAPAAADPLGAQALTPSFAGVGAVQRAVAAHENPAATPTARVASPMVAIPQAVLAPASISYVPPAPQTVLRAAEPVAMPLAPLQREPAPELSGPAIGRIQRVDTEPTQNNESEGPNYDQIAEEVWPRIRRKLRIERERERGRPS